ncbi:MAG: hypothetical protein WCZ27_03630 [Tissierellaceae bacterium]
MLILVFNVIGLILIMLSLFMIAKDMKRDKLNVEGLNKVEEDIKEYYRMTEEIIENFDQIIDGKLELIDKINHKDNKYHNLQDQTIAKKPESNVKAPIDENQEDAYIKKIIDLRSIGLTREEIARKLNKGVREIDMILKIHNNK